MNIPVGAEHGWEAAVFDHFRAVSTAIAAKDGSDRRLVISAPGLPAAYMWSAELVLDEARIYVIRRLDVGAIADGVPKSGGELAELERFPTWPQMAIASDALFWVYYEGHLGAETFTILQWDKASAVTTQLVTAPARGPTHIAADEETIYVSTACEEDATIIPLRRE